MKGYQDRILCFSVLSLPDHSRCEPIIRHFTVRVKVGSCQFIVAHGTLEDHRSSTKKFTFQEELWPTFLLMELYCSSSR